MTQEQRELIGGAIGTIENADVRELAWMLADNLPDYVWHVGASSTGKYHPAYTLGEGGLMRHMIATLRLLNHFLSLEQYNYSSEKKDLLRVAALFHDGMKCGTQEEWEHNPYTKHEHPMLMGMVIMSYEGRCGLHLTSLAIIANAIASHMGQWTRSRGSDVVLPKPVTEYQRLVHLADYLASRKDLTINV